MPATPPPIPHARLQLATARNGFVNVKLKAMKPPGADSSKEPQPSQKGSSPPMARGLQLFGGPSNNSRDSSPSGVRESALTKRMFSWRWRTTVAGWNRSPLHTQKATCIQRVLRGWLTRRGAVLLATLHKLRQFSADWTRERHAHLRSSRDTQSPTQFQGGESSPAIAKTTLGGGADH